MLRSCFLETYVLNLVFIEVGNAVNDGPRYRAPEIHSFVHYKGHDACGKDIVLHVGIPRRPQPLEDIEVNIVFGDVLELPPVRLLRRGKKGRCRVPIVQWSIQLLRAILWRVAYMVRIKIPRQSSTRARSERETIAMHSRTEKLFGSQ